eukprot:INCI4807.2.p1 GENE.INCI4807.2~~INCI4807.2.p1  ORF type:complete len:367 (-),score=96.55 INCI4807.2:422-1522(-)
MPTKPPTESAQTRRKNDDGEGLPQRDGNDDNNHNNDDGKSSVTVTALEKITDLARELEATLARAALRDGQRGALVAQHLKLVDVAAQALTESGKAIAALEGELMQAAQAARQQQEKYQAEQQQLRGEQRSLQDKCNAILASVATLQEQFAAEREGRSVAERNLSKAREEHAIEIASARSKLETVVRETEHKERLTAAQVIEEGQTLLRAKQKQLVQQHRRYTSALVTKLEAEAAAKVKQASLAAAAAAKEQGIALQQTKDENRMYKAELLRLKRLHGDVSSRVQHLQMQLFNCQQEAGRLAQSERDRVVQEHKGSEALLRREIASLESRCACLDCHVPQHDIESSGLVFFFRLHCAEQSFRFTVSF